MTRGLLMGLAAAGVLGVLVFAPGTRRADAVRTAATDTSIVSRSIDFFERRLAVDPHNYLVAGRLATRYVMRFQLSADLADVVRAEALARHLVQTVPNRSGALSRLSAVLLMQHKFTEAYDTALAAVRVDSAHQEAIGVLFDAAMASGKYRQAEHALTRLVPGSLGTLVRRSQWFEATGQTKAAAVALERTCRQLARSSSQPVAVAWCLTELANLRHALRGPMAAAKTLREALKHQPGYRGALEGLADLAHGRGDWSKAEELYRGLATDAHPDLYLRLAEVRGEQGNSAGRRAALERFLAIAAVPENEALFGAMLARYYLGAGNSTALERALGIAQREAQRRPTIETDDLLSWVHYHRGDLGLAVAASERTRRLGPPSPTMKYHRARILERLGRRDEATSLLDEALAEWTLLEPEARMELSHQGGHGPRRRAKGRVDDGAPQA